MEQTETGQDILVKKVREILEPFGFEIYPFKVRAYVIAMFRQSCN